MDACPNCGQSPPRPASAEPTRDLARVASIAEAGYLVHLLQQAGVDASARAVETFSAVTGAWTTAYVVTTPEGQAVDAARMLQAEAAADFAEAAGGLFAEEAPPTAVVNPWRMLTVLAVVAAAGAAVAVDSLGARPGRARPPHRDAGAAEPIDRLLDAMRQAPAPFRSEPIAGGPRRRLAFDHRTGVWELATDADRDGRYESRRRFGGAPVAAPPAGR